MKTLRQAAQAAVDAFAAYQRATPGTARELRVAMYLLEEVLARPDTDGLPGSIAPTVDTHCQHCGDPLVDGDCPRCALDQLGDAFR